MNDLFIKLAKSVRVKGHYRDGEWVAPHTREVDETQSTQEYAPGLPQFGVTTPPPKLDIASKWEIAVQQHVAERAGTHFDLRLGDPNSGIAHSWAIPKARLPEPGEKLLAVPQPDHTMSYMDFKGRIEEGYGKGDVSLAERGQIEVLSSSPTSVRFNLYKGNTIQEFALRKMKGEMWLIQNVTPTRQAKPDLPSSKPKYREVKPGDVKLDDDTEVLQSKIDGAHVLIAFSPNKRTRVVSYRPGSRDTGIIDHTHRIADYAGHRGSKETGDTILRGEVYAIDKDGKYLPAEAIGGMLNAGVWKSRDLQAQKGRLTVAAFDVVKYKGKDMSEASYDEKLKVLRELESREGVFHLPDTAETTEEKRKLYDAIKSGEHPQTSEGVIVWKRKKSTVPTKAKHKSDFDVYVREIFSAYDKDGKELDRAGGFSYSWTKDGPIVGRVGTGFDHATLRSMKEKPEDFLGRVAKVESGQRFTSGALRAPSFSGWHLDKSAEVHMPSSIAALKTKMDKKAAIEAVKGHVREGYEVVEPHTRNPDGLPKPEGERGKKPKTVIPELKIPTPKTAAATYPQYPVAYPEEVNKAIQEYEAKKSPVSPSTLPTAIGGALGWYGGQELGGHLASKLKLKGLGRHALNAGGIIAGLVGGSLLGHKLTPKTARVKIPNRKLEDRYRSHGLPISIETAKGSKRSGVDVDGHEWSVKMTTDYGYIRGTEGGDGEHLDCFIGPNPESTHVYVVRQIHPNTGKFDEDKVLIGYKSKWQAWQAYKSNYDRLDHVQGIREIPLDAFKAMLKVHRGSRLTVDDRYLEKMSYDLAGTGVQIIVDELSKRAGVVPVLKVPKPKVPRMPNLKMAPKPSTMSMTPGSVQGSSGRMPAPPKPPKIGA